MLPCTNGFVKLKPVDDKSVARTPPYSFLINDCGALDMGHWNLHKGLCSDAGLRPIHGASNQIRLSSYHYFARVSFVLNHLSFLLLVAIESYSSTMSHRFKLGEDWLNFRSDVCSLISLSCRLLFQLRDHRCLFDALRVSGP